MDEILKYIVTSLNVVLGAVCALGGALIQSRLSEKMKNQRLLVEKLENAYKLCQLIYDAHRKEIINAKNNLPQCIEDYLKERNHPGTEMSELRMLVNSYSREFIDELEKIGCSHSKLKQSFRELDTIVIENGSIDQDELDLTYEQWKRDLDFLGSASRELKISLSNKLNNIVT
jgi:hypothetical protein